MMREIERQASEAWLATPCEVLGAEPAASMVGAAEVRRAIAAHDFMVVRIPLQGQVGDRGGSADANAQPGRDRPEKRRRNAYTRGGR